MTTAKNEVIFGWEDESYYLVEELNFIEGSLLGGFFQVGEVSKFFIIGGGKTLMQSKVCNSTFSIKWGLN